MIVCCVTTFKCNVSDSDRIRVELLSSLYIAQCVYICVGAYVSVKSGGDAFLSLGPA